MEIDEFTATMVIKNMTENEIIDYISTIKNPYLINLIFNLKGHVKNIRCRIAENKYTPIEILEKISNDKIVSF